MMFISCTYTLLAIVVIYCFVGIQCEAKTSIQQRRILQTTTTPAPTPSSDLVMNYHLYDPGFCRNIIDESPTYTSNVIQCGNYCNPGGTDKWYFKGFILLEMLVEMTHPDANSCIILAFIRAARGDFKQEPIKTFGDLWRLDLLGNGCTCR